jgi:rhamnopyranosyl-N-acetylglucosaminyl-diphospho-decaprenol beta-1,3/1,4-galactofuranosyltransferase
VSSPSVVAIVVTYRRELVLVQTIESLLTQELPPTSIVVVDNAAGGSTAAALQAAGLEVDLIELDENTGFAGGLAAGMRFVKGTYDPDFYWLMDDDSPVDPQSLREVLARAEALPPHAVIASRGARLRRGRIYPVDAAPGSPPEAIDLCLVDGTLVPRRAVETAGTPDPRMFMMFEDYEYSLRLRRCGIPRFLASGVQSRAMHLGAGSTWRAYYQTRNHLRVAIEHRSPILVYGALDRCLRQSIMAFINRRDDRWLLLRLRLRGIIDALRGRMGRVIDPSTFSTG